MRRKISLMLTICLSVFIFSTAALAQQKFPTSLNSVQEVPPSPSSGRGACMITLNTAETQITVNCSYSGLTSNVVAAHIHNNGPVGVNGPVRFNFAYTGGTSGTIGPLTFTVTPADVADMRAKRHYVNIHTQNFGGGEIRGQVKISTTASDYDGDSRADVTVYRFSDRTFYTQNSINNSISATQLGQGNNGDIYLSGTADFDGDGRTDDVLLRLVGTDLYWTILQSATNTIRTVRWGNFAAANGEQLAIGDYDGDGSQDVAVYRRATGVFYILESSTGNSRAEQFGVTNDFATTGDFDKDGKADLTVVRVENGQRVWYTRNSTNGQTVRVPWGLSTDAFFFFAQVDVDGDGVQDRMVFRTEGSQTVYYVLQSSNGQTFRLAWGIPGDVQLLGDYDGDGKTDFVARRPISGIFNWFIFQSSNQSLRTVQFGQTNDQRLPEAETLPVSTEEVLEF